MQKHSLRLYELWGKNTFESTYWHTFTVDILYIPFLCRRVTLTYLGRHLISLSPFYSQTPSAKSLITSMLIAPYTFAQADQSSWSCNLDFKLTLRNRAPVGGHAHFMACWQAWHICSKGPQWFLLESKSWGQMQLCMQWTCSICQAHWACSVVSLYMSACSFFHVCTYMCMCLHAYCICLCWFTYCTPNLCICTHADVLHVCKLFACVFLLACVLRTWVVTHSDCESRPLAVRAVRLAGLSRALKQLCSSARLRCRLWARLHVTLKRYSRELLTGRPPA